MKSIQKNTDRPVILAVDDKPLNTQLVSLLLVKHHFEVITADSGEQALNIAQRTPLDLILLDIVMPELDGFETCKRLKAMENTKWNPIICLTAEAEEEDIVNAFELGAMDYIQKPFNPAELLKRVETHVELKRNRDLLHLKMQERQQFIHMLCHDLLNPIRSSAEMVWLLREGFIDESESTDMYDSMEVQLTNSVEVIQLVRKLMEIDNNKLKLDRKKYVVRELLHESCLMLKKKFLNKELDLVMDVPSDLSIEVDKTSFINSVICNILTNAAKYSYRGSRVKISSTREDDKVAIIFRDFGVGMPASILERLFEFDQPKSRPGTEKEIGTGFGMLLANRFIKLFDGHIEVTSMEHQIDSIDHGTQVSLFLNAC